MAYGPVGELQPGLVTVTLAKGGTKIVTVTRLGKPFSVEGHQMVYGYLAEGGQCDECGQTNSRLVSCADSSGIVGDCCPRCAGMPDYMRSFA